MNKTIGIIGLGRMGLNMAALLAEKGWTVYGFNRSPEVAAAATEAGVHVVASEADLVNALPDQKCVWLMVPAAAVESVLAVLLPLLRAGDTVIDGGNSFYQDSVRRHALLKDKGINFLDCGTSGGVTGARRGASIMVGGDPHVFSATEPLFADLAAPEAYARVGGPGAGHFVKMVHNGIEYGMMGAIAEGMNILNEKQQNFDLDLAAIMKPYEHESIITSKLVSWLATAYRTGQVDAIAGVVPQGETEFEMEHIITLGEVKVLEAALAQRKASRVNPSYIGTLVAAMRNQFGGHSVVKKD